MNWETVTSTIGQSVYSLWNNGRKLATLVFHPGSSAARIEYADQKRVFLLRKEGFLRNRTVLRNEYGILIGEVKSENNRNFIEMNNERFFYAVIGSDEKPELTIFKESKDHPLVVCRLDTKEAKALTAATPGSSDNAVYTLLMTLCWSLFQPLQQKKQKAEAALELGYTAI